MVMADIMLTPFGRRKEYGHTYSPLSRPRFLEMSDVLSEAEYRVRDIYRKFADEWEKILSRP